MAIKYKIQYKDIVGNDFVCEFDNDAYVGAEIELKGKCNIATVPISEHFEPIRGRSLVIEVLATLQEPLDDLWQDDDFYWRVVFKKNNQIKFVGYLSSEGVSQDYNADRWNLNLLAMGPIGILKDLAYVDENGNPYLGFASISSIIARALKRGFNQSSHCLNMFFNLEISGVNQPNGVGDSFATYAHIDQTIFYENDGETIQNCLDVLREVLKSIGCVIFQESGNWYIVPPQHFTGLQSVNLIEFDPDGVYVQNTVLNALEVLIGSKGNQTLFHCSRNQFLSNERSTDTFKLIQNYEYRGELIENSTLVTTNITTVDGFTLEPTKAEAGSDQIFILGVMGVDGTPAVISDPILINQDESFVLSLDGTFVDAPLSLTLRIKLYLPGQTTGDHFSYNGSAWNGSVSQYVQLKADQEGPIRYEIGLPPLPRDGSLVVEIFRPSYAIGANVTNSRYILDTFSIAPQEGIVAGVESLYKKAIPKKEKSKAPFDIRFATSDNQSIKNAFYESDGLTLIESVSYPNESSRSSLFYLSHARAKILNRKTKVFQGDVYGEVPYFSSIIYDNIGDRFLVLQHEYLTRENITFIKTRRLVETNPIDGNIIERKVFENTIKPTII